MRLGNSFSMLIGLAVLAGVAIAPGVTSAQQCQNCGGASGERGRVFKAVDAIQRVRGFGYATGYHYESPACYPHDGWSPYENLQHLQHENQWQSQPVSQQQPRFEYFHDQNMIEPARQQTQSQNVDNGRDPDIRDEPLGKEMQPERRKRQERKSPTHRGDRKGEREPTEKNPEGEIAPEKKSEGLETRFQRDEGYDPFTINTGYGR